MQMFLRFHLPCPAYVHMPQSLLQDGTCPQGLQKSNLFNQASTQNCLPDPNPNAPLWDKNQKYWILCFELCSLFSTPCGYWHAQNVLRGRDVVNVQGDQVTPKVGYSISPSPLAGNILQEMSHLLCVCFFFYHIQCVKNSEWAREFLFMEMNIVFF